MAKLVIEDLFAGPKATVVENDGSFVGSKELRGHIPSERPFGGARESRYQYILRKYKEANAMKFQAQNEDRLINCLERIESKLDIIISKDN